MAFVRTSITTLVLIALLSLLPLLKVKAQATTPTPPPEAAVGTWQCVRGSQRLQGTQYMKGNYANPPVVKWQATIDTAHGGCEGEPVIGDVNGDGKNDVIINTVDGNLFAFDGATGAQLWVAPLVAGLTSAVIGDANGDGRPDIAIVSDKLYLLDGATGNIIWTFAPPVPNGGFIQTCPNEADLKNDGNVEVVIIVDDAVYAVNGKTGAQMWTYATGHPVAATFNGSTPAIGDVNGDGYPDVVASLENGEYGQLVALDGRTGSLIWGRAVYGGFYELGNPVPAIGDVNGDCKLDVVFNGAALNGATGAVIWGDPTTSLNATWGIITDLKGDCHTEVVTEWSVLNGTDGSYIWADSVSDRFGWFAPAPKVGDFNPSSPGKEIVIGASYQMYDSMGVQVVEANPVPIKMLNGYTGALLWSYDIATLLNHTVEGFSIGDIDNDGCVEIVIAPDCCNGDPTLLALDDDGNASQCGILASVAQVDFIKDSISCNCFNFQDFSSPCANSWNWTFQGGTPATSTAKDPGQVCFPSSGTFNVTLSATLNSCPADTIVRSITILPGSPVAQFQSDDSAVCANSCINFTEQSLNCAASWQWSFQGGTPSSSTSQNPQGICYSNAGNFDVTLIASNSAGSDTLTKSNLIRIAPSPPAPIVTPSHDTLFCSYDSSYSAYQWYADTILVPGGTGPYILITTGGNYNIRVTSKNGCSTATGINVTLGIEQFTVYGLEFTISPNPATYWLTINPKTQTQSSKLNIYNVLGEILYQSEITNQQSEISIDVSAFASGVYFLQIENEKSRWIGKFLKQ